MNDLVIDDLKKLEPLEDLTSSVPTPSFAEIVIRTGQLDTMKCWHQAVLGVAPFIDRRNAPTADADTSTGVNRAADMLGVVFFDVRPEEPTTQILGLFGFRELKARDADHNGIDHFKFYHRSLSELFDRVERLLDASFTPYRSANHGPDSSFYFLDPDSNRVEFSCSNFKTLEEKLRYVRSEAFRKNISGIDVDPHQYIARFRSGIPQKRIRENPIGTPLNQVVRDRALMCYLFHRPKTIFGHSGALGINS